MPSMGGASVCGGFRVSGGLGVGLGGGVSACGKAMPGAYTVAVAHKRGGRSLPFPGDLPIGVGITAGGRVPRVEEDCRIASRKVKSRKEPLARLRSRFAPILVQLVTLTRRM